MNRNVSYQRPKFPTGLDVFLATGAYVGRIPFAPGTFGSLWGIPLTLLLQMIPSTLMRGVVTAGLCAVGIPICSSAALKLGRKDPGAIVWDEIASMPIVFFFVSDEMVKHPMVLVAGFILHRVFDITKPAPARWLERLPNGLGIMADDVSASVYACGVMHLLIYLGWLV